MKKTTLNLALSLFVSAALFSCGNQSKQEDSKEIAEERNEEKFEDTNITKDTEFAVDAAAAGMAEVELGKLAQQKSANAQVKKLAQMMVDDHSKANDELKALAQQKNITLPAAIADKHKNKYEDLSKKSGAEFDKEYVDLMVSEHKDVVDKFEKQAENGNDADLKTWAAAKVPALRHHLEMAQSTQDVVKNNKK